MARAKNKNLQKLIKDVSKFAEETPAGQIVSDRKSARAMIDYGLRTTTPESIVAGVQALKQNPVNAVDSQSAKAETKELARLLTKALKMRSGDKMLAEFVQRVGGIETPTLARGVIAPNTWLVSIAPGQYYKLDPWPVYEAHVKAIVCANAAGFTLGITVRRKDLSGVRHFVGQSKVTAVWNSGIYRRSWDVRVYNPVGPGNALVRIETNATK